MRRKDAYEKVVFPDFEKLARYEATREVGAIFEPQKQQLFDEIDRFTATHPSRPKYDKYFKVWTAGMDMFLARVNSYYDERIRLYPETWKETWVHNKITQEFPNQWPPEPPLEQKRAHMEEKIRLATITSATICEVGLLIGTLQRIAALPDEEIKE